MKVTITLSPQQKQLLNGTVRSGIFGCTHQEVAQFMFNNELIRLITSGFFDKLLAHDDTIQVLKNRRALRKDSQS